RFIDALQHGAHAGIEDFYAQKVILGPGRGNLLCGLAHAKADLEYGGGYAAERLPEIELSGLKGNGPQGHEPIQRLTLARRYMRATMNEAANMCRARRRIGRAHVF